jgi:hypothetical protein
LCGEALIEFTTALFNEIDDVDAGPEKVPVALAKVGK